mmetsp:Transcript_151332/g.264388  ORF Transcript_151332/g.264388 Transcript_151332/m.264388 type:complete len:229 (+) Transcript_151332:300-986(+)
MRHDALIFVDWLARARRHCPIRAHISTSGSKAKRRHSRTTTQAGPGAQAGASCRHHGGIASDPKGVVHLDAPAMAQPAARTTKTHTTIPTMSWDTKARTLAYQYANHSARVVIEAVGNTRSSRAQQNVINGDWHATYDARYPTWETTRNGVDSTLLSTTTRWSPGRLTTRSDDNIMTRHPKHRASACVTMGASTAKATVAPPRWCNKRGHESCWAIMHLDHISLKNFH